MICVNYKQVLILSSIFLVSILFFSSSNAYGVMLPEYQKQYQMKLMAIENTTVKPHPHQQIQNGITYSDVICSDNFVLILKWDGNISACVNPKTAVKLENLDWGIQRQRVTAIDALYPCFGTFRIHYDDMKKFSESSIIKSIRKSLNSNSTSQSTFIYTWADVQIEQDSSNHSNFWINTGAVLDGHSYQAQKVITSLQNMGISEASFTGESCD